MINRTKLTNSDTSKQPSPLTQRQIDLMAGNMSSIVDQYAERERLERLFQDKGFQEKCKIFFENSEDEKLALILKGIDEAQDLIEHFEESNCHSFCEYIAGGENHIGSTDFTETRLRIYQDLEDCKNSGWEERNLDCRELPCEGYIYAGKSGSHSCIILGKMGSEFIACEQAGHNCGIRYIPYELLKLLYPGKCLFRKI